MKKLLQNYRADKKSPVQSLYNRGQRYDQSQYLFLQTLSDEEDGDQEEIFLQPRNEEFLEKELEPGDTLQTLSIQFNCPIAELKRVNNIHRDNEVFARRIIKVPTRYYSFLSEKVVGVHKKPDNASTSAINSIDDPLTSTLSSSFSFNTLIKAKPESQNNPGLVLARDSNPLADSDECLANISLLPQNTTTRETTTVFECSGSDWGLSWLHLMICILLFLFGGPILYLLYHRVEPNKSSNQTLVTNHTIM